MKLRFLGTSAASGFPNPHCRCENCVAAREAGGKSIRMMSSVLIDDELIIDLGPDVNGAAIRQGIDFADVRWALQTHSHPDHILALHAVSRAASWAAKNAQPLIWYVGTPSIDAIIRDLGKSLPKMDVTIDEPTRVAKLGLRTIQPWQSFTFGPYRVQTVAANHDPMVEPMLFALEKRGRRLFYGTDTTSLPEDTWPRLAEADWTFDVVIFDHNDGFNPNESDAHMGHRRMMREVSRMRELGLISDETRVVGTHIAHHSHTIHEIEDARAREFGYELAWDGLIVDV